MAAIPLVCVVLFFVFGGVIAAALPGIIGGLTIAGALGIMRLFAEFMPVHFFAQPVVTLMGLGIAIDYGLFMVSRFREEIAEGYDTEAAVRRTVMTSGRTIMFSAVILVASSVPLLLFPQGFLKSITYAIIASVMLAAILSITVLPPRWPSSVRVDALGVRWLLKFASRHHSDPATRTNTFASRRSRGLLPPVGIAWALAASASRPASRARSRHRLARLHQLLAAATHLAQGPSEPVLGLLGVVIFVPWSRVALRVRPARPPIVWWLNWLRRRRRRPRRAPRSRRASGASSSTS